LFASVAEEPRSVGDILDRLSESGRRRETVSVGNVVQALGNRSYGPFLVLPSLIELSPVGGIPGVPTALAAIVVLVASQLLLGRRHLWLPKFVSKRSISSEKLENAVRKVRPWGDWLDRWFHGRIELLTSGPFVRMAAAACIVLALAVPPLELLPFASTAPMAAIGIFGLALLVRDGLLMILASLIALVATGTLVAWLLS
jgi:hypothetical protein